MKWCLFEKLKPKRRNLQQTLPAEPALSSSTLLPKPLQPASQPAIQQTSQPTPLASASTDSTSSLASLQGRLWNDAYDKLKTSETKYVDAYEKILSAELHRNDSTSIDNDSAKNEIKETGAIRNQQMQHLVQAGLDRTQKEASIKEKIDRGLLAVQAVKGMVDKAVQAAPEAAVAWVGVCLGLELLSNPVTEARSYRQGIVYVLSRMDWYWNLVSLLLEENRADKSSVGLRNELENHIVQLYQKLLLYQMKSVRLCHRNQAAVISRDMLKWDDWTGQLSDIKDAEACVDRDMEQYNTEESKIRLWKLAETARDSEENLRYIHSAIQYQIQQQENMHQDDKDKQCLKDLYATDPRKDKTRIQNTKGGLLRDSYLWILDHADFQRFRNDPQSQLLWIKGDPGKGKTMLLCGIIDELEKKRNDRLSYFFCQATEAQLSSATSVLRGLIYLLLLQQPALIRYVRAKYDVTGEKLFQGTNVWVSLVEIFTDMLSDSTLEDAVLVVDALDECTTDRPQLLDFIRSSLASSSRVKWIVSSRNWSEIENRLDKSEQKVKLHLELNQDSISAAVRVYIRHKVEELALDKKYDEKTRDKVQQHLDDNANDTFLWVALVCQELQTTDIWDVDGVIKNIPAGLEALYDRMMQHIQNLKHQNPKICRQILSTVVMAYRPLRLEELGQLTDLPNDIRGSTDHVSSITRMCGSFLTIRDGVVYIIHQSAKDFLISNKDVIPSDITHQHRTLFLRSLGALSNTLRRDIYSLDSLGSPIDQVLTPSPDPLASIRYSCIYWVDHLSDSYSAEKMGNEKNSWDGNAIHDFIQKKYLYWLESLSLLRSMSEGVMAVQKLETVVRRMGLRQPTELTKLLQDTRRFILSHKPAIEIAPLQVYASALVFSPTRSLVRKLFEDEQPGWIILKPSMGSDWSACLQTLEGHRSFVTSVVFSPDGTQLASGSYDRTVKIWDTASGQCSQTLKGHSSSVTSVVFSPDGTQLASGSDDETVKIWDTALGQCSQTLKGHRHSVKSVVFSPDGTQLASGSSDMTVKIWDTALGQCSQTLKGHSNTVASVVFSPDGTQLASGSDDETVKIWDTASGQCSQTLEGHSSFVTSVVFSPDGTQLASGSYDRTVKLWDTASGQCSQTLKGHSDWIKSVVFSPDGTQLASDSDDRTVKIWDTASGQCSQTLKGHSDSVTSVVFSPDGTQLALGSYDKTVNNHNNCRIEYGLSADNLWIVKDGQKVLWLPQEFRPSDSVVFGQSIAIGCFLGRVFILKFGEDRAEGDATASIGTL